MRAGSARAAAAAVTFLTRVPLGRRVAVDGADVARGALLFPVVGAGVGALSGGVAVLAHPRLPALAAAGIALAVAVLLTGAMHVDALADTFDAAGAPTRERALEIMRDSRIGAFGATALILDLLVKAAAVAALLDRGGALTALVAAGALSRAASPPLAVTLRYPRVEGGPGSVLTGRVAWSAALGAVGLAVGGAVLAEGVTGLVMAGSVAGTTTGLGLVYRRWLGGATGDCLGAATEIGETAALLVAAALA
jgi:cobalamin 5'-phosphate synthase/cobalamin synthase